MSASPSVQQPTSTQSQTSSTSPNFPLSLSPNEQEIPINTLDGSNPKTNHNANDTKINSINSTMETSSLPILRFSLGSTSIWRRNLCSSLLGFLPPFTTYLDPDIDEYAIRHSNPTIMVQLIALAKMQRLIQKNQLSSPTLTCDQVVLYKNTVREKPKDYSQALQFMLDYNTSPPGTTTGIVMYNPETKIIIITNDDTVQPFSKENPLTEDVAKQILDKKDALYSAGALVVEEPLLQPHLSIHSRKGSMDSIQGFPALLIYNSLNISLTLTRKQVESIPGCFTTTTFTDPFSTLQPKFADFLSEPSVPDTDLPIKALNRDEQPIEQPILIVKYTSLIRHLFSSAADRIPKLPICPTTTVLYHSSQGVPVIETTLKHAPSPGILSLFPYESLVQDPLHSIQPIDIVNHATTLICSEPIPDSFAFLHERNPIIV